MFIEILLAIAFGIFIGIFTGITPGIHINLVASLILSSISFLAIYFSPITICVFIISCAMTHSFLDILPSVYLGAPSEENVASVLPCHRMLLNGEGINAVTLSIIGAFASLIVSILTYPLLLPLINLSYPIIEKIMGYLLLIAVIYIVLKEKNKFWAIFIFLTSGLMGYCAFNIYNLSNPLLPLLSGMFGISSLLLSINDENNIPIQKEIKTIDINKKTTFFAILSGQFSGLITAILPGLGAAQASTISTTINRSIKENDYIILTGAIGTSNFVLSFVMLQLFDKARNGAVATITEIIKSDTQITIVFLLSALIAGGISVFISLKTASFFSKYIVKINYKKLAISIIIFVIILVYIQTDFIGLFILIISTSLGILTPLKNVSRSISMGCIILPVISYFLPF